MLLSARHLRPLVLVMSLGAFPVAAQTSDPVNDPANPVVDPALGATITLTGAVVASGPGTLVLGTSSSLTGIEASVLTPSIYTGGLILSSSTSATGTTTTSPGTTVNLGSLVTPDPLSGSLSISGVSEPSTITTTTVGSTSSGGTLTITPIVSGSSLVLSSGGLSTTGGTLSLSSGTLVTNNSLTFSGGTLAPPSTATPVTISTGTVSLERAITISGNLDLQSSGMVSFRLNGTGSETTNGQLTVAGDVTLSGDLAVMPAANLPVGSTFVILNKTSAGPIAGTFAGRPQGSVVSVNGNDFIISYTGGDGNDVSLTALSKPQLWRHIHFGTTDNSGAAADDADFDEDGIPNLLERACNLDPTTGSAAPFSAACKNSNLEFTYTRSLASIAAGDVFTVEWCDTLGSGWNSNGVTEEIESDDGTVQLVKALVPAGTGGHRFMRLKVTPAP